MAGFGTGVFNLVRWLLTPFRAFWTWALAVIRIVRVARGVDQLMVCPDCGVVLFRGHPTLVPVKQPDGGMAYVDRHCARHHGFQVITGADGQPKIRTLPHMTGRKKQRVH